MLIYFILGCLFTGVQMFVRSRLKEAGKAKIFPNSLLVLLSNASITLGIAWMYASLMEHEIQAAMMGLLFFGGMGVVLAVVAYRIISGGKAAKK